MLYGLERDLQLVQKQQIRRLHTASSVATANNTNSFLALTNSISR
jgi:hypothetical protein